MCSYKQGLEAVRSKLQRLEAVGRSGGSGKVWRQRKGMETAERYGGSGKVWR